MSNFPHTENRNNVCLETMCAKKYALSEPYNPQSNKIRTGCCIGIHAEGPVVADLGGLPPSECQRLSIGEFEHLVKLMQPCGLRMMTIAPSIDALDDVSDGRF